MKGEKDKNWREEDRTRERMELKRYWRERETESLSC